MALVQAAKSLDGLAGANSDQNAGIAIVRRALEAPLRQIAENAGVDGAVVAVSYTHLDVYKRQGLPPAETSGNVMLPECTVRVSVRSPPTLNTGDKIK